mmetsp:Transcript_14859/g.36373  ORF Transcript_14859/g.36373 Transcript_14859/m.36373 type:complete len:243 (+) Transcript_14859:287-1015(+)
MQPDTQPEQPRRELLALYLPPPVRIQEAEHPHRSVRHSKHLGLDPSKPEGLAPVRAGRLPALSTEGVLPEPDGELAHVVCRDAAIDTVGVFFMPEGTLHSDLLDCACGPAVVHGEEALGRQVPAPCHRHLDVDTIVLSLDKVVTRLLHCKMHKLLSDETLLVVGQIELIVPNRACLVKEIRPTYASVQLARLVDGAQLHQIREAMPVECACEGDNQQLHPCSGLPQHAMQSIDLLTREQEVV